VNDVTQMLAQIEQGDRRAAAELLPVVYDELRRLAARQLTHEKPGQTLQATALVHEAYLRLVGHEPEAVDRWADRRHFFAAAAESMRRILVESARRKQRLKRGGEWQRAEFDEAIAIEAEINSDLLALDEALERLVAKDAQAAELVQLRYFAGMTLPEAAQAMGLTPRTADRVWAYAKAWLHREIRAESPSQSDS
jgi:RNA polymerase sigma factor (TIGR02999 family)